MSEATQAAGALAIGSRGESSSASWAAVQPLACQLSLEIPVPGFTIAMLLRLATNDVINTRWLQGSDVPLYVNGKLIGWTEFEVIDDRLAARLTQIA